MFNRAMLKIGLAALLLINALPTRAGSNQFTVTVQSFENWTIDGMLDPTLTLTRGQTYVFDLQSVSAVHPFFIKTVSSTGSGNQFSDGVTGNGATGDNDVSFQVPLTAPAQLFYNCGSHGAMAGTLNIVDPDSVYANGFEDP